MRNAKVQILKSRRAVGGCSACRRQWKKPKSSDEKRVKETTGLPCMAGFSLFWKPELSENCHVVGNIRQLSGNFMHCEGKLVF